MGVEAMRAETAQQFDDCLATAMRQRGPILIEAVMTL
jgi:thiamine pyrophosphate-dependent acetolactate synthase large subunit-like protein